jgi:WD40 repeat protein
VPTAKLVWDVETPADWSPGAVAVTADGRVLAGWTDLLTLDARTGKQLARWDLFETGVLPPDPSHNTHLYPSRDGRVLGYVIQNVGIFLVDSRTGKLLRRIETPDETQWPLAFSPDGARFATTTAWTDTGVRVWDTATGKVVGRLDGSPSRGVAIAWSFGLGVANGEAGDRLTGVIPAATYPPSTGVRPRFRNDRCGISTCGENSGTSIPVVVPGGPTPPSSTSPRRSSSGRVQRGTRGSFVTASSSGSSGLGK